MNFTYALISFLEYHEYVTVLCNPKVAVDIILIVLAFLLLNRILIGILEGLNFNVLFYNCNVRIRM
jgi:hypothetical protein